MKSVIVYGNGLGWLKVHRGGVPEILFDFFVYNLRGMGYHGVFRDEEACGDVKYDPPAPPLSTMREITLDDTSETEYYRDEIMRV